MHLDESIGSSALAPLVGSGVVSVDSGGLITAWTEQAERTFGWRRGEGIAHPLIAPILAPHLRQRGEQALERVLSGESSGGERRFELVAHHRDGREVTIERALVPVPLDRAFEFGAFVDEVGSRDWTTHELERLRFRHCAVLNAAMAAMSPDGGDEEDDVEPGRVGGALVLFHEPALGADEITDHRSQITEPAPAPEWAKPEPDRHEEPQPEHHGEPPPEHHEEPPRTDEAEAPTPDTRHPTPETQDPRPELTVYQTHLDAPAPISS